ncbi:hypothetical protein Ahy_A03g012223 [Arachis hypogaea]|uniref:DUF4216 domain-containing protein n=1 Tax=Arachis hypogaea TaxID=3818 RepID=A0A445DSU3_ARAHY|nr:hypothetical protein Ahy_A03g012223 [Arachis hypogaea]
MVNEAFNITLQHRSEDITTIKHARDDEDVLPYLYEGPSRAVLDFNDLLLDGKQDLYPRCSKYSKLLFLVKLYDIKWRVDDQPVDVTHNSRETMFPAIRKALGTLSHFELTLMEKHQAHHHVLVNCDVVVPIKSTLHSKEMKLLAYGPMIQARHFWAYNVNGYKFNTITKKDGLKTQNSGVYVSSDTRSYASMRDNRVVVGSVLYYKKILDIIELNYSYNFRVVLFKCVWADIPTNRGIKQDHLGLTSINFSHPIHTSDQEEDEWLNMSAKYDIGDLQLTRKEDIEDPIENASENFDDVALDGKESDLEDNLDDISSVGIDRSMQFDLNKVSEEDNETLEDQQREDDIHVKKRCFNLNKKP